MYGGDYMLTKVIAFGALALLIGCSTKSADDQAASADPQKPSAAAPAGFDSMRVSQAVTLPAGTQIQVRLSQALDTQRSRAGDGFTATLDDPIVLGERML